MLYSNIFQFIISRALNCAPKDIYNTMYRSNVVARSNITAKCTAVSPIFIIITYCFVISLES